MPSSHPKAHPATSTIRRQPCWAAEVFRITQTEEKIRVESIRGQRSLEGAAQQVGKKVRETMREISGTRPENLPKSEDIQEVKKRLKSGHREIKKIDGAKPKKRSPKP